MRQSGLTHALGLPRAFEENTQTNKKIPQHKTHEAATKPPKAQQHGDRAQTSRDETSFTG